MKAKSRIISTRFSADELEEIKAYMTKYDVKSMNDFIHTSAGFLISFVAGMANVVESKEVNEALDKFNHEMKIELDKVPSKKAKLRGKFQIFEKKIFPKYEAAIEKGTIHIEPFAKKRKAGRPKNPKRKRGKPKNSES